MAYIIFGDTFSFPDGNAATNRVYTYAKGLVESGHHVHVFCLKNEYKEDNFGVREGISYYNPFNQAKRNKYFLLRRWYEFLKFKNTIEIIRNIKQKEKVIAVHLYTYEIITQIFGYLCARFVGSVVTLERSEHPLRFLRYKFIEKVFGKLKIYLEIKFTDGIICISNYLIDFYLKRGVKHDRLLLLPSTVDISRFKNDFVSPLPFEYILYCGSITTDKDGVDILIKSMSMIADRYDQVNLVLIGKSEDTGLQRQLDDLVAEQGLSGRVFFLGRLSRELIPSYICNAKILALARPSSRIADAGFPSKVSEYLASGNPVAVTRVGEIPQLLKHRENAFLCDPDSPRLFADTLDDILSNYEFARRVGEKGRELATDFFNYKVQSKKLGAFFTTLKN